MQRRNLLKAGCAALLAPLYAVTGKAKPIDKWTASYAEPMEPDCVNCIASHSSGRCNSCGSTDGLRAAYPFLPKDRGGFGWMAYGYRDYTYDCELVCEQCWPKDKRKPLPWERYFAKHNVKWSGDVRQYSAVRNDPEWEEIRAFVVHFADRNAMDKRWFVSFLKHQRTGKVVEEEVRMVDYQLSSLEYFFDQGHYMGNSWEEHFEWHRQSRNYDDIV